MADEDEFTELVDPNIDSVHAVGKAANGTRILFAKQADGGGAGLFGADFVQDLIAKADGTWPGESREASDAAAIRKAAYEVLLKEKYSTDDRKRMAGSGQALPDGSYPIADVADLDNAIHAVGRGDTPHDTIRRHITKRAKALGRTDMLPDTWGAKGSMKKADGEPGSPGWETADATAAQTAITAATALHGQIKALIAREATEVGAGHLDDIPDVLDLAGACDALECVLSTLAGFAAREQLEAGAMAKAFAKAPDPSRAVHDTMHDLAQACGCPACTGFMAAAKAHDEAPEPPADATDGPAAATTQGMPPATPQEQMMTTTPDATAGTAGAPQTSATDPAADDKQSKKARKLAKSAAIEALAEQLAPITALLTTQNELLVKQQGQIEELSKEVEAVKAQPVASGVMMNGAVPGAQNPALPTSGGQQAVQGQHAESAALAEMRKSIQEEKRPGRRSAMQSKALLLGLHETFSAGPTVRG